MGVFGGDYDSITESRQFWWFSLNTHVICSGKYVTGGANRFWGFLRSIIG